MQKNTFYLKNWNGRLGNNIIQYYESISRMIKEQKDNISLPKHAYFKNQCISIKKYKDSGEELFLFEAKDAARTDITVSPAPVTS